MSNDLKPKLVVILGFTGSGKSELGVKLAAEFQGEIISADSRQVYKEMNIGTGKVEGEWKEKEEEKEDLAYFRGRENNKNQFVYKNIPHYLIDFLSPAQTYSVGEFKQAVDELIEAIGSKKNIPIMVGGTAQYIYAAVDNWQIPKVPPNKSLREKYELSIKNQEITLDDLWNELIKKDPDAAEFVQREAPRRIIRALEVINATGERFSKLRSKKPPKYEVLLIGISYNREDLYGKIDLRIDEMIAMGLEKEVKEIVKKYSNLAPGLQSIGYREFMPYFKEEVSLDEAIQKIKFNTHRYVRHQNSWFNKDKRIKWVKNFNQAQSLVKKFLT